MSDPFAHLFAHPGCRWKFIREATPRARREADRRHRNGTSYCYTRRRVHCECACGQRKDVFVEDIERGLRAPQASSGCQSSVCAANFRAAQKSLSLALGDAVEVAREMVKAGLMPADHAAAFERFATARALRLVREHTKRERLEREQREMDAIDE